MEPDVLVLGGGPAGSAAAGMLARLGARVTLLTRAARWSIGESIPPSTARLFAELGLAAEMEQAGFLRSRGNTIWWGNAPERVEPYPADAAGWQVERCAARRSAVAGRGGRRRARYSRQSVVTAVEPGAAGHIVTWRKDDGAEEQTAAPWVLDCTGRAGVFARRVGREARAGRATFALHGVWEAERWDVPDVTHTLIETTLHGWAWSIPVTERRRHVTVMIDPPAGTLEGATLEQAYRTELAGATHLSRLVRDAVLIKPVGGLSASPYVAARFAGPGWALVGDAASFIDPLSSFGVKKALAAAWLAAVVVHTSLTEPALTNPAIELFERRERDAFLELTRQAEGVWTGDAGTGSDDTALLRDDPAVHAAFEALKRADGISLRPAPDVTLVPGATVRAQRVVLEPHLQCDVAAGRGPVHPRHFASRADRARAARHPGPRSLRSVRARRGDGRPARLSWRAFPARRQGSTGPGSRLI